MGTAAVVTPFSGALLDRFRAKPLLITGNLASALGYAGFAFVDRPWQAFVCSAVGGAGFGVAITANQVLSLTLVPPEQRASSIALRRVAGNFGLGSGATVAGFVVASANDLRAFQALYLVDGITFVAFALVVHVGIPNARPTNAAAASGSGTGFRAVAQDRLFLILIVANVVFVMTGGALFSNILPPFARAHTPVGPGEIGIVIFVNTFFIVVAQIPAARVVKRMRRTHALAATSALFAIGLVAVLLATHTSSTLTATTVLAGVAIVIAIGECAQFVVLGTIVADLAPPHLLGRYMSLYGLSFTAGVALGPAVGGALLATSPDAVWWGGALAVALIGAGLLRLGDRIPDPLLQSPTSPVQDLRGRAEPSTLSSQTEGCEMPKSDRGIVIGAWLLENGHRVVLKLTGGRYPKAVAGMKPVELHTFGRKSGKRYSTLLTAPVYEPNRLVVVASKGGHTDHPDWYKNLVANPTSRSPSTSARRRCVPNCDTRGEGRTVAAGRAGPQGICRVPAQHRARHPVGHLRTPLTHAFAWAADGSRGLKPHTESRRR